MHQHKALAPGDQSRGILADSREIHALSPAELYDNHRIAHKDASMDILDRVQAGEFQPQRFIETQHQVHTLDGGAGCTLH